MIDLYKDNKKSELRFVKNRLRNHGRQNNKHHLKRQQNIKHNWKLDKVTRQYLILIQYLLEQTLE